MEERYKRTDSRVLVLRTAIIRLSQDSTPIECAVLNVSTSGACILVPKDVLISDRFELILDRDGTSHECRMVWREGARLGIAFVPRALREDRP